MDKRLLKRFAKKYQPYILDFYRDEDGWWIVLDSKGPYRLANYYSEYTIHEDTQRGALQAFRECVTR